MRLFFCLYPFFSPHLNSHRLPLPPFHLPRKTQLLLNHFNAPCLLRLCWIVFGKSYSCVQRIVFKWVKNKVSPLFFFCQMVMMTQQGCPGCLPRLQVKMWHRLRRCLTDAVTLAWPPVVRRKEALAFRTLASSVTSPSGIKLTHFLFPLVSASAPSITPMSYFSVFLFIAASSYATHKYHCVHAYE